MSLTRHYVPASDEPKAASGAAPDSAKAQVFYLRNVARLRWLAIAAICFFGGIVGWSDGDRIMPVLALGLGLVCFAQCFQKVVFKDGTLTYHRPLISVREIKLAQVTHVRHRKRLASAGMEQGRPYLEFLKDDKVLCSFPPKDFHREALVCTVDQVRQHCAVIIEQTPGVEMWH